ncbi:hypothetical protein ASG74_01940 [Knoellia sp. Soil729]|nr:hypothetical protein ASG74_01940 [Knoellia sp. Soil729]
MVEGDTRRMSLMSKVIRTGANVHAALYRRFSAPAFRRMAGLPVLLLTVRGRRSGREITTPVCYIESDGGYAVTGSAGGSDAEPQWFRNLRAAPTATIEVGDSRHVVTVRILDGEERDALWRRFAAEGTTFGGYEEKTERRIPVALLTPA